MSKMSISKVNRERLLGFWGANGLEVEGTGGGCECISGYIGDNYMMITAYCDPTIPDSVDDIHQVSAHLKINADAGNFEEPMFSFSAMSAESAAAKIQFFISQPVPGQIKLKDFFEAEGMSYEYPGFLSLKNQYGTMTIGIDGEAFSEHYLLSVPVSIQVMSPDDSVMLMEENALNGGDALYAVELWKSGKFIDQIGDFFAGILNEWLDPADWEAMKAANAAEPDHMVCHSHDYCDSNVAMLEAMTNYGFSDDVALGEFGIEIMNAAWNSAAVKYLGRPAA